MRLSSQEAIVMKVALSIPGFVMKVKRKFLAFPNTVIHQTLKPVLVLIS